MKKILFAAALVSAVSISGAEGVQRNWSWLYSVAGADLYPQCLLAFPDQSSDIYAELVGAWSPSNSTGYLVFFGSGGQLTFDLTQSSLGAPGLVPVSISNNTLPSDFNLRTEILGKQATNGRKVQFIGSDDRPVFNSNVWGDLNYTYNGGTTSYDQPLALGQFPYATYAVANV